MTAGNVIGLRIWRMVELPNSDDEVGGAVPSGTILYEHVHARKTYLRPTMPLLEQGVETSKMLQFSIDNRDVRVLEKDVLEITSPVIDRDYGKKYSAVSVIPSSFAPNDRRFYLLVIGTRVERAHNNELQ